MNENDKSSFQIGSYENNKLTPERFLTVGELAGFEKNSSVVEEYRHKGELFKIVLDNYTDTIDFVETVNQLL